MGWKLDHMQFRNTVNQDPPQKMPKTSRVFFGCLAGMVATAVVHPLDIMKVRKQIHPTQMTLGKIAKRMYRCQGLQGFYAGITAGLARQATYTSTRLCVYNWLYDKYKKFATVLSFALLMIVRNWENPYLDVSLNREHAKSPSISEKVCIGLVSGVAGAIAGNPSEVALVRMMAASARPLINCPCLGKMYSRPYSGVLDAVYRISKEEGVLALWRGGRLTLARTAVVSVAQIGSYAKAYGVLTDKWTETYKVHICASFLAALVTTVLSLPIDGIKTRYQIKTQGVTQWHIFQTVVKRNGILGLWRGFLTYYLRMTAHTIISYTIFEAVNVNVYEKRDLKKVVVNK